MKDFLTYDQAPPEWKPKFEEQAKVAGTTPDKQVLILGDNGNFTWHDRGSPVTALAEKALEGLGPTTAGILAPTVAGGVLGGPLGALGGLAVGIPAAMGAGALQRKLLEKYAPSIAEELDIQQALHPVASTAGGIAAGMPAGGAGIGVNALRKLAAQKGTTVLSEGLRRFIPQAGVMGGIEAVNELLHGQPLDPKAIGTSALSAAAFMRPHALSEKLGQLAYNTGGMLRGINRPPTLTAGAQVAGQPGQPSQVVPDPTVGIQRMIKWAAENPNATEAEYKNQALANTLPGVTPESINTIDVDKIKGFLSGFRRPLEVSTEDAGNLFEAIANKVPDNQLPNNQFVQKLKAAVKSGAVQSHKDSVELSKFADNPAAMDNWVQDRLIKLVPQKTAIASTANELAEQVKQKAIGAKVEDFSQQANAAQAAEAQKTREEEFKDLVGGKKRKLLTDAYQQQAQELAQKAAEVGQVPSAVESTRELQSTIRQIGIIKNQAESIQKAIENNAIPAELAATLKPQTDAALELVKQQYLQGVKKWGAQFQEAAEKAGLKGLAEASTAIGTVPVVAENQSKVTPPAETSGELAAEAARTGKPVVEEAVKQIVPAAAKETPTSGEKPAETALEINQAKVSPKQNIVYYVLDASGNSLGIPYSDFKIARNIANKIGGRVEMQLGQRSVRPQSSLTEVTVKPGGQEIRTTAQKIATPLAPNVTETAKTTAQQPEENKLAPFQGAAQPSVSPAGKSETGEAQVGENETQPPKLTYYGSGPFIPDKALASFFKLLDIPFRKLNQLQIGKTGNKVSLLESLRDKLIRTKGPEGQLLSDVDQKMQFETARIVNKVVKYYDRAFSRLTKSERDRVLSALDDPFDLGGTLIQLTPKEQDAVNLVRTGLYTLHMEQHMIGGPGVRDLGTYRPSRSDPNYIPTFKSGKANEILNRASTDPERIKLESDFIQRYLQKYKGSTLAEAQDVLAKYLTADTSLEIQNNTPEYEAVSKAEGMGLPKSWRVSTDQALMRHAARSAAALGWYKHVQSSPIVSKIVGNPDNGWGQPHPQNMTWPGTERLVQDYSRDSSVKNLINEWNIARSGGTDIIEKLSGLVNATRIGPKSAIRDVFQTIGQLPELVHTGEWKFTVKALHDALTSERAFETGAVRRHQTANFWTPEDATGAITRLADFVRTNTGRNAFEQVSRKFVYELFSKIALARKAANDAGFFKMADLPNWQQMPDSDLSDAVGKWAINRVHGSYSSADNPEWLLRSNLSSGGQAAMKAIFSLARWNVGRYNNWYKTVWTPATEGNIRPLLKSILGSLLSAEGLNYVFKHLFQQKPEEKELIEQIRQGKVDPYSIFAKLETTGFAGIIGQLAFAGVQAAHGEKSWMYEFPTQSMLTGAGMRILQGIQAANMGRNPLELLAEVPLQVIEDNTQLLRMARLKFDTKEGLHRMPFKDIGQREERIWKRELGQQQSFEDNLPNPFTAGYHVGKAQTLEQAQKWLPELSAQLASTGQPVKIATGGLRQPTWYGADYYRYLDTLQGPGAGQAALQRDLQQEMLNTQKNALATTAQVGAMAKRFGY